MRRRAVLFDLDATLMDHDAARIAGFAGHVAECLPQVQADELERLDEEWQRLEALHYEQYARGECSAAEQRRRRVRAMHDRLGHALPSDADADAWFASYLGHYRAQWRAFEDVAPALEALCSADPELVLGVVTNGEGEPQRAKLAAIGVADRFAVVIASGEVGVAKPDAAIFALACERLGVERHSLRTSATGSTSTRKRRARPACTASGSTGKARAARRAMSRGSRRCASCRPSFRAEAPMRCSR